MNEAFNQYVYGGKNGYNASLIAYKKEVYDVKKLLPEENLFRNIKAIINFIDCHDIFHSTAISGIKSRHRTVYYKFHWNWKSG